MLTDSNAVQWIITDYLSNGVSIQPLFIIRLITTFV